MCVLVVLLVRTCACYMVAYACYMVAYLTNHLHVSVLSYMYLAVYLTAPYTRSLFKHQQVETTLTIRAGNTEGGPTHDRVLHPGPTPAQRYDKATFHARLSLATWNDHRRTMPVSLSTRTPSQPRKLSVCEQKLWDARLVHHRTAHARITSLQAFERYTRSQRMLIDVSMHL